MSTRTRAVVALVSLALAAVSFLMTASPASAYDFPSTNDANRVAGLPHVDLVSTGPGNVTLRFVNPRSTATSFEYRIDGQTVGSTPHPVVIGDVIYPGVCVDGRPIPIPGCSAGTTVRTLPASATVEIRLALGGERDWDFDWTPFAVGPKNECGTPGTNRFSVGDASVVEGDSGAPRKVRIPVTISNPSASEISVDYIIDEGSATAPDDIDTKIGVTRTLVFKPNMKGIMPTTKTVTVKVLPDTAVEGDETITVTLSNPTGGYTVGRKTGTGTIIDDDGDSTTQAVAISGSSSCEGDSSTKGSNAGYQVSLRNPAAADAELTVLVGGGTATGGVDYQAVPKPKKVKFKAGQVQKKVNVIVLPDLVREPDENVGASIATSPLPVLSSAGSADIWIINDDATGV
jgi:Calx-beta domain